MKKLTSFLALVLLLLALTPAPAHATITFFGSSANVVDNNATGVAGSSMTITPPSSMTAGMLAVVIVQVRQTSLGWTEVTITNSGGQKWHELNNDTCGTTSLSCRLYATRFNGTWSANPVFDGIVATSSTALMVVFQESDGTKQFDLDVMPVFATFAAGSTPFTKTISAITTQTNGAVALAVWMSVDDNTWGSMTAGWSYANPSAGNQVRNLAGSDQSITAAYQVFSSAGSTGSVSQNEATNGGDAGGTLMMAFKTVTIPGGAAPTVDIFEDFENSTDGTTITATILTNGFHGSGCTWAAASSPGAANTIATASQMSLSSTNAVKVSTTTYDDASSTRGVSRQHTADDTDQGTFNCSYSSNKAVVSWGYFFNSGYGRTTGPWAGGLCGTATVGCDYTSMAMFADGSGAFTAFNINASFSDALVARLECNANVPQLPHFTPEHTYWITFKMDTTAGKCYGAIFDPSDSWKQLGFTVFTTLATGSSSNRFQVFMTGGSFEPTAVGITRYDGLAIDYTTAAYPIVPGTTGGGGGSTCIPRLSMLGVSSCGEPLFVIRGEPHR